MTHAFRIPTIFFVYCCYKKGCIEYSQLIIMCFCTWKLLMHRAFFSLAFADAIYLVLYQWRRFIEANVGHGLPSVLQNSDN
jgi:hypothetical protein